MVRGSRIAGQILFDLWNNLGAMGGPCRIAEPGKPHTKGPPCTDNFQATSMVMLEQGFWGGKSG